MIVRPLGRGGMGEVFVARTPWEQYRVAAVKRLRPDVARVPTFAERFRHEALDKVEGIAVHGADVHLSKPEGAHVFLL